MTDRGYSLDRGVRALRPNDAGAADGLRLPPIGNAPYQLAGGAP